MESQIGFPDGLLYSAPYLYAANGVHPGDLSITEFIKVIELLPPYKTGKIVGAIRNPLLDQPSTIAFVPGTNNTELLAVNYQVSGQEEFTERLSRRTMLMKITVSGISKETPVYDRSDSRDVVVNGRSGGGIRINPNSRGYVFRRHLEVIMNP